MFCFTYDLMSKAMQSREMDAQTVGFAAVAVGLGMLTALAICMT